MRPSHIRVTVTMEVLSSESITYGAVTTTATTLIGVQSPDPHTMQGAIADAASRGSLDAAKRATSGVLAIVPGGE